MKKLNQILNIQPDADRQYLPMVQDRPEDPTIQNDFDYARENLMDVIGKGQEALFDLMDVARQSQHPRAYEVLSTMMNTLVGANKDLLDLQAKKKKLLEAEPEANNQQVTNNLFVGSTAELQKMIDQRRNNSDADVDS
jgi:hypothetical protein